MFRSDPDQLFLTDPDQSKNNGSGGSRIRNTDKSVYSNLLRLGVNVLGAVFVEAEVVNALEVAADGVVLVHNLALADLDRVKKAHKYRVFFLILPILKLE